MTLPVLDCSNLQTIESQPCWFQDDMRVVVMYVIARDSFVARYDTMIEGAQYNIGYEATIEELASRDNMRAEEFARLMASQARVAFLEGRAARSRILYVVEKR
jgi:hypothetical protein